MLPLSYRFVRAGAELRSRGFRTGWRSFGDTLFSQIRGGGYVLETEAAGCTEIAQGMGFCIPAGVRNRVSVPAGQESTAVFSHLHCRVYELQGLFTVLDRPIVFDRDTARQVGACNDALIEHQKAGVTLGRSVEVSSLLARLVSIAVEQCPELEVAWQNPDRRRLLPAIRYVQDHLGQPICREDIARAANISVPHLHVLSLRAFGVAPMELVRRERMQKARQLLHWSDLSVAQVGWECGYEDQYYFSRAFKAAEGMPPSRYRGVVRSHAG
jgi:AraC-like DNA-binding protein